MQSSQKIFRRIEKKYIITKEQYEYMLHVMQEHMVSDKQRNNTVFSVYFDTPDDLLIRRSIDKPVYKEKLRLRTYGVPDDEASAFIEIKKKFKKVVYKRRVAMTYKDAQEFLLQRIMPDGYESQEQIINEISWFMKNYDPIAPSMLISYDRTAYYAIDSKELRITFDSNILWRDSHLYPSEGAWGQKVVDESIYIMEIKIPGAMPLWLAQALSKEKIYPSSFSKAGTAYRQKLLKGEKSNG